MRKDGEQARVYVVFQATTAALENVVELGQGLKIERPVFVVDVDVGRVLVVERDDVQVARRRSRLLRE